MKEQNWIIGIGGSEVEDVIVSRVRGTASQVRFHLISKVKADRAIAKENGYDWDYGTVRLKDVVMREDGSMYAYACYSDFHIDYSATPEMPVLALTSDGGK